MVSVVLLLMIPATAGAEIFRCELADGSVIYGDKPVNLSDACQPVTADSAKEYLSIQQDRSGKRKTAVVAEPVPKREAETRALLDRWLARSTTLVESYNNARTRRIRESYMVDKRKAMQEMASLNAEKQTILAELQESPLREQERLLIRNILAEIPEDAP
jgi:hypothetical protein